MAVFRYLTLVWPGLPWLWLRGSRTGLVLALAFAVAVDVGVLGDHQRGELRGGPADGFVAQKDLVVEIPKYSINHAKENH